MVLLKIQSGVFKDVEVCIFLNVFRFICIINEDQTSDKRMMITG